MDLVESLKKICDKEKLSIGFINRGILKKAIKDDEIEIVYSDTNLVGFCHFHHRKDSQTTIYTLVVDSEYRNQGFGRLLFYKTLVKCIEKEKTFILLKCPIDNESNTFYRDIGFTLKEVVSGKKRDLNVYTYLIKKPLLVYCADGGRNKYSEIAKKLDWMLGVRSDSYPKHHVQLIDNNWKDYNHIEHLNTCKKIKPLFCTVKDVEKIEELEIILKYAENLKKYCGKVLLIPKIEFDLSKIDEDFWLAYSVPTKYGKTSVPYSFFQRPTHLLGGSPKKQLECFKKLPNPVSLDGNIAMKISKFGKSIWQENHGIKQVSGCYPSFELSLIKQKEFWENFKAQIDNTTFQCEGCFWDPKLEASMRIKKWPYEKVVASYRHDEFH